MSHLGISRECVTTMLQAWHEKPWLMLGIGYYFAFSLSVVVNCPRLVVGTETFYPMLLVRVCFSATISIGLIAMMFLMRKLDVLSSGQWAIAFAVGTTSLGTFMLVAALNYIDSIALVIASTALIGAGNSVLLLSWGALFLNLSSERLAGHVTLSCLFAAVLCLIIHVLPPVAYFSVVVALPLASGITLILCANEQPRSQRREVLWQNGLTKILISCIVMGLACGLLRVLPVFGSTSAFYSNAVYATMIGIFLLNLMLVVTVGGENPILYLYRFCLPLFVAGYSILMIGTPLTSVVSIACALGGSILFECLVLLVFPYVAIRAKGSFIHLFGWCAAAQHAGSFAGFLIGDFTSFHELIDPVEIAFFSMLTVIVFVCLFFFVFKELDIVRITESLPAEGVLMKKTLETRLSQLTEECRLSPREVEVLRLLARGRSLPYIEENLAISHSTARTHVKHIYEKPGVTDRQQLHDLIQLGVTEHQG